MSASTKQRIRVQRPESIYEQDFAELLSQWVNCVNERGPDYWVLVVNQDQLAAIREVAQTYNFPVLGEINEGT